MPRAENPPGLSVIKPTVEHAENPLGIDVRQPRFGWQLEASSRGQIQTEYRITVHALSGETMSRPVPVWDSGPVQSCRSVGIRYSGDPLTPRTRYTWTVQVRGGGLTASTGATRPWFETALLDPPDWTGRWITHRGDFSGGCALLRRDFNLGGMVSHARLYITAAGVYDVEINGTVVSSDRLSPGWTDYHSRLQYQTYDVTSILRPRANAIAVRLGPGWYAGRIATAGRQIYGSRPALLAQLEVTDSTGRRTTVVSDAQWCSTVGGLVDADLLDGENYDARREPADWSSAQYDATNWRPVLLAQRETARLVAQRDPPMRTLQTRTPTRTEKTPDGYLVDFGQNIVGTVRLTVRSGRAGDKITLRHGETLESDGRLHTDNLRTAAATDRYTASDTYEQTYEPRFTSHGFRYVQISGLRGPFSRHSVTASVVGTDAAQTGWFETSDPMLNQLQQAIVWSQRANFTTIPTDCPQRDERLGWTGEASSFVPTAVFNMDCRRSLGEKWLTDLRDAQRADGAVPDVAPFVAGQAVGTPGWGDAIVAIPHTMWQTYGDASVIDDNYDAMARWVGYLESISVDHLLPAIGWGDWTPEGEATPREVVNTALYVRSLRQMAAMATITGKAADAARLRRLGDHVRTAFVRTFFDNTARMHADTQAAYALALSLGLLPPGARRTVVEHLVRVIDRNSRHVSTGMLATPYLFSALSENGRTDIAYDLLQHKSYPSWAYQLAHGATTLWEHWDSILPDGSLRSSAMNSLNHYIHGSIGDWMYRTIGGLNRDPRYPGYRHIIIRPRPGGGITSASLSFESVHGRIESRWHRDAKRFILEVRIPANTTATVHVPAQDVLHVTEHGRPATSSDQVGLVGAGPHRVIFKVGSGSYLFVARQPELCTGVAAAEGRRDER